MEPTESFVRILTEGHLKGMSSMEAQRLLKNSSIVVHNSEADVFNFDRDAFAYLLGIGDMNRPVPTQGDNSTGAV